ncbi:hypothetical protein SH139x_005168 [Planctomycetaceae bacterium SH139]
MSDIDDFEDLSAAAIRRAARHVLGDSPAGRAISDLCDDHAEAVRWIHDQRTPDATMVAVVGATGQGKSWLVRQFIDDQAVRRALPSGDTQSDATRRLVWVGPQPPAGIDSQYETYLHCAAESMTELGGRYLLVDTPGATDLDPATAQAAQRAVAMSSVLVMVIRRQQLRSEVPGRLAAAGEGTLVLPVITAIRSDLQDANLRGDVDALVTRLRLAAPRGEVLSAVLVPDFELGDADEATIGQQAIAEIRALLRPHLAVGELGNRRRSLRLQAARERFTQQIRQRLADQLPRLSTALEHLDSATDRLPYDVAVELIGSGQTLRAGIRSRLRAELMVGTAAIWFPYRTLLGLLNLTHGAWDRLILALSGSLPSLVGSAWAGLKNLREGQDASEAALGIRQRSAAMIADRIVPLVNRFHTELARLRPNQPLPHEGEEESATSPPVRLMGIDSLREQTQQIFDAEVVAAAPRGGSVQLLAMLGTAIFWLLLAGPIVALYHAYGKASLQTLSSLESNLTEFPHPDFGMVFTSLLLSLLPTALFAMLVITWVQGRRRQEVAAAQIEQRIKSSIDQLQADGVLRLEFRDPLVTDARRLLRAGRSRGEQANWDVQ